VVFLERTRQQTTSKVGEAEAPFQRKENLKREQEMHSFIQKENWMKK
jgi:hypothetical protein